MEVYFCVRLYSLIFFLGLSSSTVSGKMCSSIEIRNNIHEFQVLEGCEVIEGFLYIVLIYDNQPDINNLTFPLLKEITFHLLFYHVNGLKTLRNLFPNLSVIRGQTLFRNYALVIFEMESLVELGLTSLTVIQRGSVRIEMNPNLCYVKTINWTAIAPLGEHHYIDRNKKPEICSPCSSQCENCWSGRDDDCQIMPNENKECDQNCLAGCKGPGPENCHFCKRVSHNNQCVDLCPDHLLEFLGRRCVTEEKCRAKTNFEHQISGKWKPFNKTCIDKCPPGFREVHNNNSTICREKFICNSAHINSLEAAEKLNGCKFINGSLEIMNVQGGPNTINELRIHLGLIERINGYLKISNLLPLISLDILPHLNLIEGETLEWNNYAIVIKENPVLSRLWPNGTGPRILHGRIFAQNNPKLCPSEVEQLTNHAGLDKPTDYEVSPHSNGNRQTCNGNLLETSISTTQSETVIVHWNTPTTNISILGFAVFYSEVSPGDKPLKKIDFDLIEGCRADEWQFIEIHENDTFSQILTYLKPYTWYAYYVSTFPFTKISARSIVKTFLTLPSQPSRPRKLEWKNVNQGIKLRWDLPKRPNGHIDHYLVTPKFFPEDLEFLSLGNFCYSTLENESEFSQDNTTLISQNDYISYCNNDEFVDDHCGEYFDSLLDNLLSTDIGKDINLTAQFPYENEQIKLIPQSEMETEESVRVSQQEIVLNLTKPYGRYVIRVAACRNKTKDDSPDALLCSIASFVNVRTLKISKSDKINTFFIKENNENMMRLIWEEPENPNGAIVAFNLEVVMKRDQDGHLINLPFEALDWPKCISRKQWLEHGKGLNLPDLPSGLYHIRLRAVSLAGPGPFTEWLEWKQTYSYQWMKSLIFAVVFITLFFFFSIMIWIIYNKIKRKRVAETDLQFLLNN